MSVHYRSRTQDLNLNNRVISFIAAHIKCDRRHRLAVGAINFDFRNWGQYCVCGKHAELSFSRISRPCGWKSDKSQWTVEEILRGINQCLEIIVFGIVCLFVFHHKYLWWCESGHLYEMNCFSLIYLCIHHCMRFL